MEYENSNHPPRTHGSRFKYAREKLKYSIQEFSALLEITPGELQAMEADEILPSDTVLLRFIEIILRYVGDYNSNENER